MKTLLLQRAVQGIITLFILTTIVFFLTRATGNPAELLLGPEASMADVQALTERLGLDEPLYVQYAQYVGSAVRGDLGESLRFRQPTTELYFQRLPATLRLAGIAAAFALCVAIPLGAIAGARRGKALDKVARVLAVIGVSAPEFWIGLALMQLFAVNLGLLPAARMGSPASYVLPAVTMSLFALAGTVRLLRSSMIEILDSEFIKFARVKGVPERTVVWKHALRNSLVPVLSFSGIFVSLMMGGAIVVETVFAWPGVGRLAYEGLTFRDYPVVQTVILLTGALIILVNFITDFLYSLADPRIKLG